MIAGCDNSHCPVSLCADYGVGEEVVVQANNPLGVVANRVVGFPKKTHDDHVLGAVAGRRDRCHADLGQRIPRRPSRREGGEIGRVADDGRSRR